jgi:CBS domain-containing protein
MNVGKVCRRMVYTAKATEPLATAVAEMHKRHVGTVVVVEPAADCVRPIGILTDRDAVCGQLSRGADLFCLTVGEVMTANPFTLKEDVDVSTAVRRMSARTVRRAPVVSASGDLVGIVSVDDLIPVVAAELNALAQLLGTQAEHERDTVGDTGTIA